MTAPASLLHAYHLGQAAASLGQPCRPPYQDIRRPDNRVTYSRAYINAWKRGWRAYHDGVVGQLKLL